MASTYLTSSYGSTTNRRTWTYSFWIKRAGIGAEQHIWSARNASSTPYIDFRFEADDIINFYEYNGSGYNLWLKTTRKFRDTSGWYHFVVACDTTQATSSNRLKLYINGVQETSFSTETYPAENLDTSVNVSGYLRTIGSLASGVANFNGSLSHFYFIDGLAYPASTFGSTDATTGEWKINTSPTVTMGTNGFTILKDGNTITDQSINSNNWTLGAGTLTNTEDCPSDVFCTINPLTLAASQWTLANGNTSTNGNGSNAWRGLISTLAVTKGKYYFETKVTGIEGGDPGNIIFGITDIAQYVQTASNAAFSQTSRGYGYRASSGNKINSGTETAWGNTYTTNDIIGCAFDLDNNKIYFSKNGTWETSGDPTSGATGTGAAFTLASGYTYTPAFSSYYSAEKYSVNYGNGYFGTTAIASEGTNASNIGKFEYDVPTGFTALSTKGLQE